MNKFYIFIFCIIIFFLSYIFIYIYVIKINKNEVYIDIPRDAGINTVIDLILIDENNIDKKIYFYYIKVFNKFFNTIKFGEFRIKKNLSLFEITNLISKPSNVYKDFTIIGGWQNYQLKKILNEKFIHTIEIPYSNIIADTYKYQSHNSIEEVYELMQQTKKIFFDRYENNELLKMFSINDIMIISSLVEKEGKTVHDKKIISSVIINRLNNDIKLQIDASTIFSITEGNYKLNRKLTYKDLKIKNAYNTYYIKGLPPGPICYVSRKTIEIVLENYKSNYLYYFFDENNQRHTFSKSFEEHKKLLKEYRKK